MTGRDSYLLSAPANWGQAERLAFLALAQAICGSGATARRLRLRDDLVGRLGPRAASDLARDHAREAAAVDAGIKAGGDGADRELPDLLTMQNAGRRWASSMGLSCVVAADVDILTVTATWGRYAESDVLHGGGGISGDTSLYRGIRATTEQPSVRTGLDHRR